MSKTSNIYSSYTTLRPSTPHLTLLPRQKDVVCESSALARRGKHTVQTSANRRKGDFRVDVEQSLAWAAWRPDCQIDVVLLVVSAVEGAVEGERGGGLMAR
jgi:hypothetical protein